MTNGLIVLNSLIFISYGLLCLFTKHMEGEFKRYGLSKFRLLTGLLELLGGLGTLVGFYYYRPLFLLSSGGLALLMALGLIIRIKLKDPLVQAFPAFILCGLNLYLFFS